MEFHIPWNSGILSIPITIIAVIALTNAINMIDGVDGLAAGVVLFSYHRFDLF